MCPHPSRFLESGTTKGGSSHRVVLQPAQSRSNAKPTAVRGCLLVLLLAVAFPALAHGPHDHSARLIVGETQLELMVTMGADTTRSFLSGAGLASRVNDVLSRTAGQAPYSLPLELSTRIFELSAGGQPLEAGNVAVITDGMESIFLVAYPRPQAASLSLRAVYFRDIELMGHGTFVAVDDQDMQLAIAPLSRGNAVVQLALPSPTLIPADGAIAATEANPHETVVTSQTPARTPAPLPQQASSAHPVSGYMVALIAGVAVISLWILRVGLRVRQKQPVPERAQE